MNKNPKPMNKTYHKAGVALLVVMLLQLSLVPAKGFVLMGPPNLTGSPNILGSAGQVPEHNFTDDMGAPQPIKEFFRWNIPYLTYSFDASFVQYFGLEGMAAVDEAVNVVNNFFSNDVYQGVSSMDLARHGFLSNYNSHAVNVTAQNRQIIDIKSLALGMLINHLGLGNPHRYAYGIAGSSLSASGTQVNFNVVNRNYDPLTLQPTGSINNVSYSYRLIHDQTAGLPVAGALALPTLMDMEEFTSDVSGNAYSAVASITDSFYGNTALFWTDIPTLFNFGSFYHNDYAVGGQNSPRHTLTYDDAGGLKYLYRTNNYVFELLDGSVSVVTPSRFTPDNVASQFPSQSASVFGLFPRRNIAGTGVVAPTSSTISREAFNPNPQFVFGALRGGIDSIQFTYQPFDSLLGIFPVATNQFWTDTFINTNGVNVLNVNSGASYLGAPNMAFFTQRIGRTVSQPDFIFSVEDLGLSVDGVPVAWDRSPGAGNYFSAATDNQGWVALNIGTIQGITNSGPGIITMSDPAGGGAINPIVYRFSRTLDGFEVLWSGEPSVLGNTTPYSLWGHIFGPGSADFVTFPNNLTFTVLENAIAPTVAIPTLSMASDDGGATPILPSSLDRTGETLTLLGNNLASVQQIEILAVTSTSTNLLQTISSTGLIVSDQKINIPPGVVNYISEGTTASSRKVRVRNSVGVSDPAPQAFGITTGRPVVTGTSADGETFDRASTLTLFGYGFKETAAGTTQLGFIRVEDSAGNLLYPTSGISTAATFNVVSDTEAVLNVNAITSAADGANRRIRVARNNATAGDLSLGSNALFSNISSTPAITTLGLTSSQFRRDVAIDLTGTGFITATQIELVKDDGTAFSPAVVLDLPAAGVSVNANGTTISIAANAFTTATADGNGSNFLRRFRVHNEIGFGTSSAASTFNVNVQPTVTAIAGFSATHPTAFDRSQSTGDDITITGTGLLAATEIQLVDETGTALGTASTRPRITLPVNGVTVTDTSITIDTQTITFADGANADSNSTSRYRRFQVLSSRTAVNSPISQRFDVALQPTFASLGGTGYTAGIQAFERNGTLIFTGANLGYMTKIEIVDQAGNPITGVTAIDQTTLTALGGSFTSTTVTVTGDDFTQGFLMDSVGNSSRRVRVSNPVGSVVSANNSSGYFSVSNLPTFSAAAATVYAGTHSGFDGNGTYDNSVGDGSLWINSSSSNMRGVKAIYFQNASNATISSIAVDAVAPPVGVSFSADGTRIIIASTAIPAGWYSPTIANASLIFTTAANRNSTTPAITTQP